MQTIRRYWFLAIIFFLVIIFYYPVLGIYFSGDDFFHFSAALTNGSLGSFIKFFGFYPISVKGYAFYRPIFREVLYHLYFNIFGLNHLPFRILSFVMQFINCFLVYILIDKIFKNRKIAFLTTLFTGICSANIATFYYSAGGIQVQGALMFLLLSLIYYLDYLKKGVTKRKFFAVLFYILAVFSHEAAIFGFGILVACNFLWGKTLRKTFLKSLKDLWWLGILVLIFIYLDIKVIGFSAGEVQYQPTFNIKNITNSFGWYLAWAIGIPEMFQDFVGSNFAINPNLMKYWGNFVKPIFWTGTVSALTFILANLYLLIRRPEVFKSKALLFLTTWFLVGVAPYVFLPLHRSTYYLVPVLPAFWGIVFYLITLYSDQWSKFSVKFLVTVVFLLVVFCMNFVSVKLGEKTYWSANRGRLAGKLIKEFSEEYSKLSKGAVVYFKNDPDYPFVSNDWGGTAKQAYFALNNRDALRLFYRDPTIEVYYEGVNDGELKNQNVIEFEARLN